MPLWYPGLTFSLCVITLFLSPSGYVFSPLKGWNTYNTVASRLDYLWLPISVDFYDSEDYPFYFSNSTSHGKQYGNLPGQPT